MENRVLAYFKSGFWYLRIIISQEHKPHANSQGNLIRRLIYYAVCFDKLDSLVQYFIKHHFQNDLVQCYLVGDPQNGIKYNLSTHEVQEFRFLRPKVTTRDPIIQPYASIMKNLHFWIFIIKVDVKIDWVLKGPIGNCLCLSQCFSTFFASRHPWSTISLFGGNLRSLYRPKG